mgnify:CR=1 FL=1
MEKYKIKIGDLASVNIYSNIKIVDHKLKHSPNSLTKTIPATIEYLGNFDNIIESDNYIAVLENNEKFDDLEVNDAKQIIEKYIQKNNIKKNDLLRYADNFNSRVYKYISILEF